MTEKRLFTPGPLNTSRSVKEAMLRDLGSRDPEFRTLVRGIRERLLTLAGASKADGFEVVLVQGSGTFGVESVLSSAIPAEGKLLVLANGAYAERIATIAERHGIRHEVLRWREDQPINITQARHKLEGDREITHLAAVHCETSTGMQNPLSGLGALIHERDGTFILDAMSSFGAIPIDVAREEIDFLISSANKCIQGVPGFSFVLAHRDPLERTKTMARTLSLDLYEQWQGLETNGQFRFTPPTHVLLAFAEALDELEREGGIAGRFRRYQENHRLLIAGVKKLGFIPYLADEYQSIIITAFHYPKHPNFRFDEFYRLLSERGMVIYPGKLTTAECFRLGNIGHLFPQDIEALLVAIRSAVAEMGVPNPVR